jgi:hypothetical protein
MEQHAYAFAVRKQPHDQVDAQMTRGTGHEHQTGARDSIGPTVARQFRCHRDLCYQLRLCPRKLAGSDLTVNAKSIRDSGCPPAARLAV